MKLREAKLPLEVIILIIAGILVLTTGVLLFSVYKGALPYFENGLYGLLLIIFALQTITLGRTPFGDLPRSTLVLFLGLLIAVIGMVTCLIPISIRLPRILLFLCFGPGGLLLFLQLLFAKDKLRRWAHYGGIFRHLIVACGAVYVLSMVIALLLLNQRLLTTPLTAVVILVFGVAVFYLAIVLEKIDRTYPEAAKSAEGNVKLSTEQVMILFTGIFHGDHRHCVDSCQFGHTSLFSKRTVRNSYGNFRYPDACLRKHSNWPISAQLDSACVWSSFCPIGSYIMHHSRNFGTVSDNSCRRPQYFGRRTSSGKNAAFQTATPRGTAQTHSPNTH